MRAPHPGWFTLTYRSAHGCWIGSKQIERGLKAHSGRVEQRIKFGDRWKKDRETASQKYDTQHQADRFNVWGGLKYWNTQPHSSAPKVTKGQVASTSRWSASPNQPRSVFARSQFCWRHRGNAAPHGSPLACTPRVLLDLIQFLQWWKLTDTDEWGWVEHPHQFVAERRRTNKIKSKVSSISGSLIDIESALIDFPPL